MFVTNKTFEEVNSTSTGGIIIFSYIQFQSVLSSISLETYYSSSTNSTAAEDAALWENKIDYLCWFVFLIFCRIIQKSRLMCSSTNTQMWTELGSTHSPGKRSQTTHREKKSLEIVQHIHLFFQHIHLFFYNPILEVSCCEPAESFETMRVCLLPAYPQSTANISR